MTIGYPIIGGLYDPVSDNWQTTSGGANTPMGRDEHSAIWSGTEMIIWGGRYCDTSCYVINSGGRYNPITDLWTTTSTGANNPVPRSTHTSIWAESEMIVWGSDNGYDYGSNTGGRYNSVADSWKLTSIGLNVPDRRNSHTAVSTGNNMIIWGGHTFIDYPQANPDDYLNTGGIYSSGSVASPGNSLRGYKSSFINLKWISVFGAGSYNVKRCNPTATGCIPGATISKPTINQYSEPDDGLSHFYAVEAVNQCGAMP